MQPISTSKPCSTCHRARCASSWCCTGCGARRPWRTGKCSASWRRTSACDTFLSINSGEWTICQFRNHLLQGNRFFYSNSATRLKLFWLYNFFCHLQSVTVRTLKLKMPRNLFQHEVLCSESCKGIVCFSCYKSSIEKHIENARSHKNLRDGKLCLNIHSICVLI